MVFIQRKYDENLDWDFNKLKKFGYNVVIYI